MMNWLNIWEQDKQTYLHYKQSWAWNSKHYFCYGFNLNALMDEYNIK